jgi:hypothetical protein
MSARRNATRRFRVGDWVSMPGATSRAFAQIIEDRGPIGVNGRRLYRVRYDINPEEPHLFEMPEDELEPTVPPDRAAVIRYLKGGGLLDILRSNLGGGPNQPRAWLTFTSEGDATHTFDASRGVLGGKTVPFFGLHEYKVFTGKREQVIDFLMSFGLTRAEAEDIIQAVGTAP